MSAPATSNPKNRFLSTEVEWADDAPPPPADLEFIEDHTRNILSTNDSPDIGFTWSVNPYRGCFHGCTYCYARPTHEYLGLGAGTDFERKIVVKPKAGELLREAFEKPSWKGELLVFSGVTDCYQPAEAQWKLTRACLSVCAEYRNPVGIITKGPLIERDLDLLLALHERASVQMSVSIPLWDREHSHAVEPYCATPQRRMETVRRLAAAGLRVGVNVAPLIPGLGDEDIVRVLEAAKDAGAESVGSIFLRLPGAVAQVFEQRLVQLLPLRAEGILHKIRDARGGKLNDPRFGNRQRGEGPHAQAAMMLFKQTAKRLGLRMHMFATDPVKQTFTRPERRGAQMKLF
ncbi:MAG: PA0069 family radical SAM protein [Deltaproteobacteria bacterium]|nr:PA0069 family radical SAM protein [Deltaproteobacteria bacterium]